jgi:cytoskeletal protein CcmA (bactofilin family)
MFKQDEREDKKNFKEAETIIGPSVMVKGNFHGEGNIIIEGGIEGSIKTTNSLLVGSSAKINASVEAKEAKIGGEINGPIKITGFLEITETAKINGDIEAGQISIARGALINGLCKMGKQNFNNRTSDQAIEA